MKKIFLLISFITLCNLFINAQSGWTIQASGTPYGLNSVFFTDENTGYIVSDNGIIKTSNGGIDWIEQPGMTYLYSIYFTNTNIGYIVGSGGAIIKTTNAGIDWFLQSSGTTYTLFSVYFINDNIGYAVGDTGMIIKTTNGGINWITQLSGTANDLYSVYFTDVNTGYAVGGNSGDGIILKTTNAGADWIVQTDNNMLYYSSVFFNDINTGFVSGHTWNDDGIIRKTTDAGVNWSTQASIPFSDLNSIYFVNSNIGYAVGYDYVNAVGIILKTINGGIDWISQANESINNLHSVYFTNIDTGYIVGMFGEIYKTTTGGSFLNLNLINGAINDTLYVLSYPTILDAGSGYQTYLWSNGSNSHTTQITSDGWYSVTVSTGSKYITSDSIYTMQTSSVLYTEKTNNTLLYPNPCDGKFTIEFENPNNKLVLISIYDITCKIVFATKCTQEKYEFIGKELLSGVYTIKIKTDKEMIIKEMIKQ